MPPHSIVVVDPCAHSLDASRSALVAAGWQVRCADDAFQALVLVDEAPPEVLLIDLDMPAVDGLLLAQVVTCQPSLHATLVIATARPGSGYEAADAKAAGCAHFVPKPLDHHWLARFLGDVVARAAARR